MKNEKKTTKLLNKFLFKKKLCYFFKTTPCVPNIHMVGGGEYITSTNKYQHPKAKSDEPQQVATTQGRVR